MDIDELPTPSLLVDLDALERNIAKMAAYCKSVGCGLRPHVKAHKTAFIARKQIAAGAIGVCTQTLEETETMIQSGIGPVLLTNMISSENAITRFLDLRRNGDLMVTVDSALVADLLAGGARRRGLGVEVLVEINVGQNRTGVEPGQPAAKLATHVSQQEGLEFKGLMGYEGHLQLSIPEYSKRKQEVHKALTNLSLSIDEVKKAGLEPKIVTSGGTGTYNITAEFPEVNEIQPGSYVVMDNRYNMIETSGKDFENALTVLSTVISTPNERKAIVDMGWKACSVEYQIFGWDGMPRPLNLEGVSYSTGGDEHGILNVSGGSSRPNIGDKILFIPSHCDTTLNLYSKFYGVRGNNVEMVCPITRR